MEHKNTHTFCVHIIRYFDIFPITKFEIPSMPMSIYLNKLNGQFRIDRDDCTYYIGSSSKQHTWILSGVYLYFCIEFRDHFDVFEANNIVIVYSKGGL